MSKPRKKKRPPVPVLTSKMIDEALAEGVRDGEALQKQLDAMTRPRYRGGELVYY